MRHLAAILLFAGVLPAVADPDPVPRPGPAPAVAHEDVESARDRGVTFLIESQRPAGNWGSGRNTKGLNIAARVPGAHHAFTTATTALCVEALAAHAGTNPRIPAALDRAEAWLLEKLPHLGRADGTELYNNWGHAYSIKALLALHAHRAGDPDRQARLLEAVTAQIARLANFEFLNGGWGYYNFGLSTKKPDGIPTSFTTATVLIALHQAREAGLEVDQGLIDRGLRSMLMQRFPDGAFGYSLPHRFAPRRGINRPAGSLARAPACNAALRLWTGKEHASDADIADWLDRLITRGGWIEMARKRPIPHEAHFQNSGYFFYYGYYYAGQCVALLPTGETGPRAAHLTSDLLRLQEKDGSWWDYPLYDYHQPYGTAYALSALTWLNPRLRSPQEQAVTPPAPVAATPAGGGGGGGGGGGAAATP